MDLPPSQVASNRRVGRSGEDSVYEIATRGGLHLLVAKGGGGRVSVLGAGPHPALARYLARKNHPDVVLDGLAKSDPLADAAMARLLPRARAWTAELARALDR